MVMFVADIGGTNIRFTRIEDAFLTFRKKVGYDGQLDAVSIAVAAPVKDDLVEFTNNHWMFSKSALLAELGTKRLLRGCQRLMRRCL
jgi:glucokinase